jgi:predicted Ser/Thr protein kinase
VPAELPRARKRLAEGITFGRYVLIEELGAGGMGVVYSALDPDLNRRVALKLLRGDRQHGGRAELDSKRLLREARAMARLHHPNVVTVHDVGSIDGRVFVAMEYVDGPTLKSWLTEQEREWRELLPVMLKAARGLMAAHETGIIHRDFKPENVLLSEGGVVKVLDFGLARPPDQVLDSQDDADEDDPDRFLTRPGVVLGTPLYMSPEQHRAFPLDERSDQFSFCAVTFEVLFGQRAFLGKNRQQIAIQACNGQVSPIPKSSQVPTHVKNALLRGLSPEPGDRWPSMQALLDALQADPTRARRRLAGAVIGVGALAAVATAAAMMGGGEDPCAQAGAEVERTWNDEARDGLRVQLTNGDAWTRTSAQTTERLLDSWAQAWSTARTDTCEATRVRHSQSEERRQLRLHCLEVKAAAVEEILAQLVPATAVRNASSLPDPSACGDASTLDRLQAQLDQGASAVMPQELAVLESLAQPDDPNANLEHARALLETARANEDLLTQARIDLVFGDMQRDDPEASARAYEHAAQTGIRLGDPELATQGWMGLARLDASQGRAGRAKIWLRYADAEFRQLPDRSRLGAELTSVRALVQSASGDHAGASESAADAVVGWRAVTGEQSIEVADALSDWSRVLASADRPREAQARQGEANALLALVLGEGHPEVGKP